MTWLKLDDGFADHPKIDGLSDGAFRLHVAGMLYAARHLTDGAIPARAVPRLMPGYDVTLVAELVDAGLWHHEGDGYEVHDFLEWNPSADEAKAKRKARQEAGRKGGLASGRTRSKPPGEANAPANAEANAQADRRTPSRPVPSRPSSSSKPPPTSSAVTAPALDEEEETKLERAYGACLVIADRVLVHRAPDAPTILNPTGWLKVTAGERLTLHRDRALELLDERPTIAPDELADLLEPDLAPVTPAAPRDPDCPDCAGSLWVDAGDAVTPCSRCRS